MFFSLFPVPPSLQRVSCDVRFFFLSKGLLDSGVSQSLTWSLGGFQFGRRVL